MMNIQQTAALRKAIRVLDEKAREVEREIDNLRKHHAHHNIDSALERRDDLAVAAQVLREMLNEGAKP